MDASAQVKHAILELLIVQFGIEIETTFQKFYIDEPLSSFIPAAYQTISNLLGKQKAKELVDQVVQKYQLSGVKYE